MQPLNVRWRGVDHGVLRRLTRTTAGYPTLFFSSFLFFFPFCLSSLIAPQKQPEDTIKTHDLILLLFLQIDCISNTSRTLTLIDVPSPQVAMIVTRAISVTNFLVASSALGFQVFVLYPWHKELDDRFSELKQEHLKVLDAAGTSISEQKRRELSGQLDDLKSQSSRRWWRL